MRSGLICAQGTPELEPLAAALDPAAEAAGADGLVEEPDDDVPEDPHAARTAAPVTLRTATVQRGGIAFARIDV
jgi:hypothetical protein